MPQQRKEKRIYAGSRCCRVHGFYAQCIETMYFIAPYGVDGGQMGTCFCLVVTAIASFVLRQGVVWSLFPGNGAGRAGNFPGGGGVSGSFREMRSAFSARPGAVAKSR